MEGRESIRGAYDALRRRSIADAMEDLLKTVPFDKVTVASICNRSGISRPTFYHYFKDKYDVVQWRWSQAGEQCLRECGRSLGWYESNLLMLREIYAHKNFFVRALENDVDPNSCIRHGCRERVEYLKEAIRDFNGTLLDETLIFQIEFFVDAESRAISAWARGGMRIAPETLARRIESCVPRRLHECIERACENYIVKDSSSMS